MPLTVWNPDIEEEDRDLLGRVYSFGTPRHVGSLFTDYLLNADKAPWRSQYKIEGLTVACSPELLQDAAVDIYSLIRDDMIRVSGPGAQFADVEMKTDESGRYSRIECTMKVPTLVRKIESKLKFDKPAMRITENIMDNVQHFTAPPGASCNLVSSMEKRISDEWLKPNLGLEQFVTEPAQEALTLDKVKELRRSLPYLYEHYSPETLTECSYRGRPIHIINPPKERINPMKTSIIQMPFHALGFGAQLVTPTLVDIPRHCEIVHISGNSTCAVLHITTSDNANDSDRTAKAFFVVPGDVDLPGWITATPSSGRDYSHETDDDVDEVFVRRLGKFTTSDGELFFVFERRERN